MSIYDKSLTSFLGLLVLYIVLHALFFLLNKYNKDDTKFEKWIYSFLCKWFPAIYLIFVIIYLVL